MRNGCPRTGCDSPGLSPHWYHSGSTSDWYEGQAREERRARHREKERRFGEPATKSTPRPERVENFEPSDREDIPLGQGDCPECGTPVQLYSDHMRGWRGPLCGCGWRGKPIDYTREAA